MIDFHIEHTTGVPPYLQIVQQVRQAVRLGMLGPGDQLPTVKEAVGALTINPNTVLKAYRELDRDGIVTSRRGVGTFVAEHQTAVPAADVATLRAGLADWVAQARRAGLDDESMSALFGDAVGQRSVTRVA